MSGTYSAKQKEIVKYLERFKVMSRDHLVTIFFSNIHSGIKTCNTTMKKLRERRVVKAITENSPQYHYTLDGYYAKRDELRPNSLNYNHHLAVCDLFCAIYRTNVKVVKFHVEPFYGMKGILNPDLVMLLKLPDESTVLMIFEVQLTNRSNEYYSSKIYGYQELYEGRLLQALGYPSFEKLPIIYISEFIVTYKKQPNIEVYHYNSLQEFMELMFNGLVSMAKVKQAEKVKQSIPEPIAYTKPIEKIPTESINKEKENNPKSGINVTFNGKSPNGIK